MTVRYKMFPWYTFGCSCSTSGSSTWNCPGNETSLFSFVALMIKVSDLSGMKGK